MQTLLPTAPGRNTGSLGGLVRHDLRVLDQVHGLRYEGLDMDDLF